MAAKINKSGSRPNNKKKGSMSILDELEKTASAVVGEVRQVIGNVTDRISDTVGSATEKPAEMIKLVLSEVIEIGESSLEVIGSKFEDLREHILSTEKAASKKTAAKKTAAKKTSATSK